MIVLVNFIAMYSDSDATLRCRIRMTLPSHLTFSAAVPADRTSMKPCSPTERQAAGLGRIAACGFGQLRHKVHPFQPPQRTSDFFQCMLDPDCDRAHQLAMNA